MFFKFFKKKETTEDIHKGEQEFRANFGAGYEWGRKHYAEQVESLVFENRRLCSENALLRQCLEQMEEKSEKSHDSENSSHDSGKCADNREK